MRNRAKKHRSHAPAAFVRFVDGCGTHAAAAEKLGVTRGFISQILNGHSALPARKAIEWSGVIGVPVSALFPSGDRRAH